MLSQPKPEIDLTINVVNVADPAGGPTHLFSTAEAFQVSANLKFRGLLAPAMVRQSMNYTITYYYESIDGASQGVLGTVGPSALIPDQFEYGPHQTALTVPARELGPGTYKLAAQVSFGGGPSPIIAFDEGLIISISDRLPGDPTTDAPPPKPREGK